MADVRKHNEEVLKSLEKGDIVEFNRELYSHFAVYLGNEEIIHFASEGDSNTNSNSLAASASSKFRIQKGNFWSAVGTSKAYKKNRDDKLQPFPKDEIITRALSRLDEVGYSVIKKNCEHFVTWCRYGKEQSEQINDIAENYIEYGSMSSAAFMHGLKRTAKQDDAV